MTKTDNLLFLSHIKLKNFRAYAGEVSFASSLKPSKTITIIQGNIGFGKTTILNGIYWCLYEKERYKKTDLADECVINSNVLKSLKLHDRDETTVEIFLDDNSGTRYKIRRTVKFSKEAIAPSNKIRDVKLGGHIPDNISYKIHSDFIYKDPIEKEWVPFTKSESVTEEIERLFPEALSSYFLFDTELLDDFYVGRSDEHVKNGIEKISGLPMLDNLKTNLKNTVKEIEKSIGDKNDGIDNIRRAKNDEERELNEYREKLDDIEKRVNEVEHEKDEIDAFLEKNRASEIQGIRDQRIKLKSDLAGNKDKTNEVKLDIKKMLLETTPRFLLKNTILDAENKLKQLEKQGEIPRAITKTALDSILTSSPPVCICGTPINEGSPEHKEIVKLSEKVVDSAIIQELSLGRNIMEQLIDSNKGKELSLHFNKLKQKRFELSNQRSEMEANDDRLIKKLEDYNEQEVREKGIRLRELVSIRDKLIINKGAYQNRFDDTIKDFKRHSILLKQAIKEQEKYQFEQNKMKVANKVTEILENMRSELVDKIREQIANRTTEYFHKLVSSKASDFSKIEIKDNYKIIALDHNGNSKKLSSGQSVCLALSYIAAIREIAQKNYFMIIDSPLLKISNNERKEIAHNLPLFLPNTQVILLVQDQEHESIISTLRENASVMKEYILKIEKADNGPTMTSVLNVDGIQTQ